MISAGTAVISWSCTTIIFMVIIMTLALYLYSLKKNMVKNAKANFSCLVRNVVVIGKVLATLNFN